MRPVMRRGLTSRFASLDGCVASTDGKLSILFVSHEADKQNNALARRRASCSGDKEEERMSR